jgi:hypothetical protein
LNWSPPLLADQETNDNCDIPLYGTNLSSFPCQVKSEIPGDTTKTKGGRVGGERDTVQTIRRTFKQPHGKFYGIF